MRKNSIEFFHTPFLKLAIGLEPTTYSLRMSCTTNCATQAYIQTKEELISSFDDQSGNRTRVYAVRGRRLSRLTNWPKNRDINF